MEDKIINIRELEKKFTGFQSIPKGNAEMAYVFFQSRNNEKYAITTEKRKIMSAELRNGKYDRIMEIKRGWFEKKIQKVISCREVGHFFTVELNIGYYISDPEYIYLNRTYSVSVELERVLSSVEGDLGSEFSFTQQAELLKTMRFLIESKLRALTYLECSLGLQVDVDESARALIDNQREHELNIDKIGKRANEEQLRVRNEEDLRQLKIDNLGRLMNQYGANAGNLISHADGELSGKELSDILKADKKEQTEMNFEMLLRLYKEGMIDETNMGGVLEKILPGIGQSVSSGRIETKKDDSDENQEDEDQEPFRWKKS